MKVIKLLQQYQRKHNVFQSHYSQNHKLFGVQSATLTSVKVEPNHKTPLFAMVPKKFPVIPKPTMRRFPQIKSCQIVASTYAAEPSIFAGGAQLGSQSGRRESTPNQSNGHHPRYPVCSSSALLQLQLLQTRRRQTSYDAGAPRVEIICILLPIYATRTLQNGEEL